MSITELQRTIWENCGYESAATQKIRNQALIYYCEYKQHLKEMTPLPQNEGKIQNLMLISYFISEKSEVLYDMKVIFSSMKGNRMSNIALSINQLIKRHSDYKEFFYHMKEMLRKVHLPPQAKQSEQEISALMRYFSFVMTFYNKFLSTFEKITICHNIHNKDFQYFGGEKQYHDSIKYLLWILFIILRKNLFRNGMDTIRNTCLLACLFSYFVSEIYKQEKITAVYAPQIVDDLGTFPNQYQDIQLIFLRYFCLNDLKTYSEISNIFFRFIENLTQKLPELKQPFSLRNISHNIKRLQEFYHKNMEINQIDETLFLKNLSSLQQNMRFTAFGANKKIKQYHANNMFMCKRTLNYDTELKNCDKTVKKESSENEFNSKSYMDVMKKIKASQTPVILIQTTPVTQFANAYNWLYKKSLNNAQREISLNLGELLEIGYKEDVFQLKNKEILEKQGLIEGLFYELLSQYPEPSQETINVASILALEVFSYVMNISNRQITELVEGLNISWLSVWEGVDILLNYDKTMPSNIKTHLLLLETSIVSFFIWKESDFIESISTVSLCEEYKEFFYRVLHHVAYQLHFICKDLTIPDSMMDQAFIVCQYFLKECGQMMEGVNLDVVIMCAIYGVSRAKNVDVKFKSIILSYKKVNNMDDRAFETIQVFEDSDKEDFSIVVAIIKFYNSEFLPNCKSLLMKIKDQVFNQDEDINSANYVLSPVKSILPTSLMSQRNQSGTPNFSQMLTAYYESPLLKKNKNISLNLNYLTNMENIEGTPTYAKKLYNETEVLRQRSSNISQMLQEKFGTHKKSTLVPKSYHPKQ